MHDDVVDGDRRGLRVLLSEGTQAVHVRDHVEAISEGLAREPWRTHPEPGHPEAAGSTSCQIETWIVGALEPERLQAAFLGLVLDGHDPAAMQVELEKPSDSIRILMLRTVKGRFLPGLENTMESHYLPPNDAQYQGALRALEAK